MGKWAKKFAVVPHSVRDLNFIQRSSLLTGKKGEHVFRTRFSIHSSLSAFSSYVFMGYARMGRRLFHGATRSLDYADSCSRRRLVTAVRSLNFSLRFARVFFLYYRSRRRNFSRRSFVSPRSILSASISSSFAFSSYARELRENGTSSFRFPRWSRRTEDRSISPRASRPVLTGSC